MSVRRFLVLSMIAFAVCLPQRAFAQASPALVRAQALIASLAPAQQPAALAADVSGEGHWTFANPSGERFTAASADEMKRVLPTLLPEAAKPGTRLALVLTEESVFIHRQHLKALALANDRRTDLMIAVDGAAYPLLRRGADRFWAEIRANLLLELSERRLFDEAVWQLAHPLKRATIRVLALEPGGPATVTASARLDPQSKRALTDQVVPAGLLAALRTLGGQTVMLTARRDGEALVFRPSSGPEQSLPLKDVLAAAEAADVNLVLLQSATPRQPGTRSWLWQRVSVGRLDDALGRDHLADFLNAVASPQGKLLVAVEDMGGGRVRLRADPLKDESSPRTGIGEALSELASNIVGQVVVTGVEASLRDRARQTELDRRLLPGVPSIVQWIYGALLALGLAGHSVGKVWWERIWPTEARESYGGAFGYLAARAVRGIACVALFLPLVGLASAPLSLIRQVKGTDKSRAVAAPG